MQTKSKPLRPIGDKVVVELLPLGGNELIVRPQTADYIDPVREALVWYIGSACKADISVGSKVLVKSFTGAPAIKHNDITLRLYNTEDVLAVFTA